MGIRETLFRVEQWLITKYTLLRHKLIPYPPPVSFKELKKDMNRCLDQKEYVTVLHKHYKIKLIQLPYSLWNCGVVKVFYNHRCIVYGTEIVDKKEFMFLIYHEFGHLEEREATEYIPTWWNFEEAINDQAGYTGSPLCLHNEMVADRYAIRSGCSRWAATKLLLKHGAGAPFTHLCRVVNIWLFC